MAEPEILDSAEKAEEPQQPMQESIRQSRILRLRRADSENLILSDAVPPLRRGSPCDPSYKEKTPGTAVRILPFREFFSVSVSPLCSIFQFYRYVPSFFIITDPHQQNIPCVSFYPGSIISFPDLVYGTCR